MNSLTIPRRDFLSILLRLRGHAMRHLARRVWTGDGRLICAAVCAGGLAMAAACDRCIAEGQAEVRPQPRVPATTSVGARVGGQRAEDLQAWRHTVRDHIGHDWQSELVRFTLQAAGPPDPRHWSLVLLEGEGEEAGVLDDDMPFQPAGEAGDAGWRGTISCVMDLPAFGVRTLRLVPRAEGVAVPDALAVERDGRVIRISSGMLTIEVPAPIDRTVPEAQAPAPILRMRNERAGRWIGSGRFEGTGALNELDVQVDAGAVTTDATLRYGFEHGTYRVRLRVIRGQPEVLWDEEFDFARRDARLVWDCAAGHDLTHALWMHRLSAYEYRRTDLGIARNYRLQFNNEVTTFRPWIPWYINDITTWMELWESGQQYAVGIFTGDPLAWNPRDRQAYEDAFFRLTVTPEREALLALPLRQGVRAFGLSYAERTPDERIGRRSSDVGLTDTACRKVKYAETPLDEVKDYVLTYEGDAVQRYPRWLFAEADRQAWVDRLAGLETPGGELWLLGMDEGLESPVADFGAHTRQMAPVVIADPVGTADPVRAGMLLNSLSAVRAILWHATGPGMGVAPHNWMTSGPLRGLMPLLDISPRLLTEREREVVRARMLFCAYTWSSRRFWWPEAGLHWLPNMTTIVKIPVGFVALTYPDHPRAQEWLEFTMTEVERQFEEWTGPDGGWIEAPHYAAVSLDYLAGIGYAMLNAGHPSPLHDPRLRGAIEWLARTSTPPNPDFDNRRQLGTIGHTYHHEASNLFGYMALAWRERDPEFSAHMQWLWNEQGLPMHPFIGGAAPTTEGYRHLMTDPDLPAAAPDWTSQHFRELGVVLRSGFPGDRETWAYLPQGGMHTHYDHDHGSFSLWGKGRLLCADWGRNQVPASQYNRVVGGGALLEGGRIADFAAQPRADYVLNEQGAWTRRVLLVKDEDPTGPTYLVLRDNLAGEGKGDWWLWLHTAEKPVLDVNVVRMRGRHDVDMDVWLSTPGGQAPALLDGGPDLDTRTLPISCAASGYRSSQEGLRLDLPGGSRLVSVLYPRLHGEAAPTITSFQDGRLLVVESAAGKDYVFLSDVHAEIGHEDVQFQGTVGVVQVREDRTTLTLSAPGTITAAGRTLRSDEPASQVVRRH